MTLPNPVPLLSSSMVAPCLSGLDRLATTNLARSGATDQNLRKILYAIASPSPLNFDRSWKAENCSQLDIRKPSIGWLRGGQCVSRPVSLPPWPHPLSGYHLARVGRLVRAFAPLKMQCQIYPSLATFSRATMSQQ